MKSLVKKLLLYGALTFASPSCKPCDPQVLEGIVVDEKTNCTPSKYSQYCSYALVVDTEQGRYSMQVEEGYHSTIPLIALEAVIERGSVISFPTSTYHDLSCVSLFSADKIGKVDSGYIHLSDRIHQIEAKK